MKKFPYSIVPIALIIGIFALFCTLTTIRSNPYKEKQISLAANLGVEIKDYPYQSSFPEGYFDEVLKPGMKLDDVHKIVVGFDRVLHCDSYREIYYYFDIDDTKALRFEVIYNENGNFQKLRTEDENSRTIRTERCSVGLLIR